MAQFNPAFGGVGGGGFVLGPPQNIFTGANRAAAEAARLTYQNANDAWLTSYNNDTNLNIRLEFSDGTNSVAVYQVRNSAGSAWLDSSSSTGIQGPRSMLHCRGHNPTRRNLLNSRASYEPANSNSSCTV